MEMDTEAHQKNRETKTTAASTMEQKEQAQLQRRTRRTIKISSDQKGSHAPTQRTKSAFLNSKKQPKQVKEFNNNSNNNNHLQIKKSHSTVVSQCTIPGCTTCTQQQQIKQKTQQQKTVYGTQVQQPQQQQQQQLQFYGYKESNNNNSSRNIKKSQHVTNNVEVTSASSCSTHSSAGEQLNEKQAINIENICNWGMIQLDRRKSEQQQQHKITKQKPVINGLTRLNSYPTENGMNDGNEACVIFEQSAGQWK
eukprot:TRINITY_DN1916_c1_g1_i3.p1 TRINITY_DN1916_c1_g1~~TRINITY_DN1916_c1_g1_i3.p1  ORF type:complete len:252 (+),score=30.01 TRINITY_DN1916_c1_g1_i3:120-875(+)